MWRSAAFGLAALLLLGSPVGAEEWEISAEIKQCVRYQLDVFIANFSKGSESCPNECANCLTDPINCLTACASQEAACGCATDIPSALDSLSACCDQVWDILQGACVGGLHGLGRTVVNQIMDICEADEGNAQAMAGMAPATPGSLLAKTKTAVEEGTIALLAGLQAAAARHPNAGALLELRPRRAAETEEQSAAEAEGQSADAYVAGHSMGSACVSMLEAFESEHGAGAGEEEGMPDLRAAAVQIAGRAADVLGKELPTLEDKVHRAMVVNWSEDGPGMNSQDICEVILRHHDSL